jgi:hypothetical protein
VKDYATNRGIDLLRECLSKSGVLLFVMVECFLQFEFSSREKQDLHSTLFQLELAENFVRRNSPDASRNVGVNPGFDFLCPKCIHLFLIGRVETREQLFGKSSF